jgi:hypothetical protein
MIKYLIAIFSIIIIFSTTSCRTTKQINKAIAKKDTVTINLNKSVEDSLKEVNAVVDKFKSHHIDFKTFNAKIKVEYEDNKGKQPDVTATVRIMKDSAIWVSLSATILNIEVYRILITKDSVILVNKLNKEIQYRSLDYLQEITGIPFDYYTLQDLLIGNPIFMDGKIIGYKKTENTILLSSVGKYFKHLITLSTDKELLQHSKLDDVDFARNRTADITYSDYENKNGIDFSTYREITVSEKNKLDIRLNYKSYEFNKDLSVSFSIPKNYKRN